MKDFEARQRELFKSHIRTNLSEFSKTSDSIMSVLSTRKLIGRLDAQQIMNTLTITRAPAWAAISINLHNQLSQLTREVAAHVGTQLAVMVPVDLRHAIDEPVLGTTVPQWLHHAQLAESQRILKSMRAGHAVNATPLEAFLAHHPFAKTNSTLSALTVTAATGVMNRVALEIFKLAGVKRFKLATNGDIREPKAYELEYGVESGPQAPMFIGDRSYPVIA